MGYSKVAAAILLAMAVAGCQASPSTSNAAATGAATYEKSVKYFQAEREAAISSIKSQAAIQCKNAGQESAVEQCFQKVIFESFGSPSAGRDGCPKENGLSDYANCVTAAASDERLEQKLKPADRFEPTDEDLHSAKEYSLKVMSRIESEIDQDCNQKTGAEHDRCQRDAIKQFSELPERLSATCELLHNSYDYGDCLGQGMRTVAIEKAADRLNAKSGI
jgi:hypothetical protein